MDRWTIYGLYPLFSLMGLLLSKSVLRFCVWWVRACGCFIIMVTALARYKIRDVEASGRNGSTSLDFVVV